MTPVLVPPWGGLALTGPSPAPTYLPPAVTIISQVLFTYTGSCNMSQLLQDPENSTGGVQKSVKTGVANALLAMLKCNAAEAIPWRKRVKPGLSSSYAQQHSSSPFCSKNILREKCLL